MRINSLLDKEFVENLNMQLLEIKLSSKEVGTISKVQVILSYIKDYYERLDSDKVILAKSIEDSMKQARRNNSDRETTLYIIHGDLINSKISVEKARELYDQYLNLEIFENKIQ